MKTLCCPKRENESRAKMEKMGSFLFKFFLWKIGGLNYKRHELQYIISESKFNITRNIS